MDLRESGIRKSIDVDVPVRTAYDQWTQFEEFPVFMSGVKAVHQLDSSRLCWEIEIGEENRKWSATITDQVPDRHIAWTSSSGTPNSGVITFTPLTDTSCRVDLDLHYTTNGMIEAIGDILGIVRERVISDLERFKYFIEDRGTASGGFRGVIANDSAPPPPTGTHGEP
jgi:uncharacterized membrane protein